jgi:hypothetical protein
MHDKNEKEVGFEEEQLLNLDVDHYTKQVDEETVEHEEELAEKLAEQVEEELKAESEAEVLLLEETVEISETEEVKEVDGSEETEENVSASSKEKKFAKAQRLVEQSKQIVQEADERTEECRLVLMDDLKEYEDAKKALKEGGYDGCGDLLEKLGYQPTGDVQTEEDPVVFEEKEVVKPMVIKGVSSGKFSGFVLALLGGAATAAGLVYLATEKLGMTLNVSKIPSTEERESILTSFSTMVGLEPDLYIGSGLFAVAILLVMYLLYRIRVGLKASSSLHFAVKQFVESELYIEQKSNCKTEMDLVDAHMKDAIETMKHYEVLFNEQEGKLKRILHFEGEKGKSTEYHEKSFLEIRETKELMRSIKDFMSVSMSHEGKLSENSVEFLQKTKNYLDKTIDRLY